MSLTVNTNIKILSADKYLKCDTCEGCKNHEDLAVVTWNETNCMWELCEECIMAVEEGEFGY